MIPAPPLLEPRLQRRYRQQVQEQLASPTVVAAGVRSLPGTGRALSATQATYRFFASDAISLPALAFPLLQAARDGIEQECQDYALVVHDWSNLHYAGHASKKDRVALSCTNDLGYELQTALLVSDQGQPISPAYLGLRAANGVHSTACDEVRPAPSVLDGLLPVMDRIASLAWDKPVVHLIDAEADSAAHYRQWSQAGHRFVVRGDEQPRVEFEGRQHALGEVADLLQARDLLRLSREVLYHGKKAQQYVAEAAVVLTRAARPHRDDGEPRRSVPGEALPLRLVVAEVRDHDGQVLARWLLLSNIEADVSAETIALWYYWRWQIESYFKLLKSAGLELEHWQQETAKAIARRLLVAAMACVLVWRLERDMSEPAAKMKTILIRLSGRQMKRSRPVTAPALLAGLWVLLAMLDLLEAQDLGELRALVAEVGLDRWNARPPPATHDKPPLV